MLQGIILTLRRLVFCPITTSITFISFNKDWLPLRCSACIHRSVLSHLEVHHPGGHLSPSKLFPPPCIFIISPFYLVFEYWIRTSERCLSVSLTRREVTPRLFDYVSTLRFSSLWTISQTQGSRRLLQWCV